LLGPRRPEAVEILHVGSTIPRKRIDILLRVFAGIRESVPAARLIRVSGPFTPNQSALLHRLGLEQSTTIVPFIPTRTLAALYRRATLVVVTSDAEGFGLPIVEAMACGATVIASDLPALREIGSGAALFATVGDVDAMIGLALDIISERATDSAQMSRRHEHALANAARFSWEQNARGYAALYRRIIEPSN
jgi:glycosyltransferase involved in cell wall biosynthesis